MKIDKGFVLTGIVFVTIVSIFGYFLVTDIIDASCGEGIVTDKFILPNFRGTPEYYFVLDNESDITTSESNYYKYDIGDYYNPCNR